MLKKLALTVLLACAVFAEAIAAGAPGPSAQKPDYQMGPGDLLTIQVSGSREFDQTTRVSNSGRIRVPYVGIMFVAGMTPFEVEAEIARKIKEHQLITEPSVRVNIDEFRAQPAYVIGEVENPGQFVVTGELYLLDLVGKAGGLRASAGEVGYLYRRNALRPGTQVRLITTAGERERSAAAAASAPEPALPALPMAESDEEVLNVNLRELREGTRPEINVRLEGGDIFYVPRRRAENIYVIGDVKVPGIYTLPRRAQITAAQAVIYAGGPLATAKMSNGFLMRHDDSGVRQSIPVDFRAIIDGAHPDIPVKPNDIIFVPNSAMRTVGIGLLNLGPRLLQQFLIF